jgi:hypothetical protein
MPCRLHPFQSSTALRHQEKQMTSTSRKLAMTLGVAGAIALAVPSAEARNGRNAAIGFGIAAGALALGAAAASAAHPGYYYGGYYGGPYGAYAYSPAPYAYGPAAYAYSPAPYAYDSYGYYGAPVVYYGRAYRNRSDQIPGTNYNPNQ